MADRVSDWASPWASHAGFEHFVDFFRAPNAFRVLRNTVAIALLKLAFLSLPPMVLAILLNEIRVMAFKRISQTISYLPHFISWVVIGGIIYDLLNPSRGLLNKLLLGAGITAGRSCPGTATPSTRCTCSAT